MEREPDESGRTAFEADFFEHPAPQEVARVARDAGDRFFQISAVGGAIAAR